MGFTLEELIAKLHTLPPEAMNRPVAFDYGTEEGEDTSEMEFVGNVEYDPETGTTYLEGEDD